MILTACSDGAAPPPIPAPVTTTVTDTSTPTPSPSAAPLLPDAARQPTRPGAEAFVRHFFAVYNHAYWTADSRGLQAISDNACIFCNSAIKSINGIQRDRELVSGGRITVSTAVAAPGDADQGLLVNLVLEQERGATLSIDGKTIDTTPERVHSRVDAAVRWAIDHWIFLDAHIYGRNTK
jgi:hypothetical protein